MAESVKVRVLPCAPSTRITLLVPTSHITWLETQRITNTAHHTPCPPARTSAHGNQTKENSEKEANPMHGTPGRGPACFGFCFQGLHIAPWLISLGLCLHTSVNMVPIALQHSSYKLLVGSTSLLPSHKRLGRNDWGPKERSSVVGRE